MFRSRRRWRRYRWLAPSEVCRKSSRSRSEVRFPERCKAGINFRTFPREPADMQISWDDLLVNALLRRVMSAAVALTLFGLIASDLSIGGFRTWWDRHSLTGSIVSNLLVLAVTGLIVDEVVARRQRRERATSVAVQGLIVFGQARRACDAIISSDVDDPGRSAVADELRTLASMLVAASPSLFDDPEAHRFLEQVERFSVSMFRAARAFSESVSSANNRERLRAEMAQLKATVDPLLKRIPLQDRALLEGPSGD
jgi:hypothetical protein